ncbi:MAG: HAD-IA family hydrolase [Candidatus Magasanikbacteria bacterium]|jgi:HAD superfamily hydrolase (TIGR01509 family)|nr:HAD-IA family hydrolase [Candidatus Magasanikbacteria bacterium]MBT5262470.1 HAD-IA family hydrolase [Candidatus Magasanikbacteria bacterium]MBT5820465.1 HAD-IA family hydrolase [Candidatus Magasanikbacteria bacterium]MBT6294431.1 HAD-IA family hydrolase [Candidatus Magasanikbacteria bacterium]
MKTILVDAVHTFVIKGEGVFEEMHALLEEYKNRKIIITGANDEQVKQFGLDKAPYEVFTLKHDPEKSDPAYYTTMLKHFDLAPEDVVYVEHNEVAVESARSVGITTFHYDALKRDVGDVGVFLEKHIL